MIKYIELNKSVLSKSPGFIPGAKRKSESSKMIIEFKRMSIEISDNDYQSLHKDDQSKTKSNGGATELPLENLVSDLEEDSHEHSVSVVDEHEDEDEEEDVTPIMKNVPKKGLLYKSGIVNYS